MGEKWSVSYQAEWINGLAPFDHWNERLLLAVFAIYGLPRDYLDIGSGTGAMANMARRMQIEAYGVDILDRPDGWLIQHDLREPFIMGRDFDLVTCIETAEHIHPDSADIFAETVARHVRPGGLLIWTAATPSQDGHGHDNAQPPTYWRTKLWELGKLNWREERGYRLALAWQLVRSPLSWLPANVQVFSKISPHEVYPLESGEY
jgi:SAM-dependent methyltransferase